jgi:hypothetical protein
MFRSHAGVKKIFLKLPGHKSPSEFISLELSPEESEENQIRSGVDKMKLGYPYSLHYNNLLISYGNDSPQNSRIKDGGVISIIPVLIGG